MEFAARLKAPMHCSTCAGSLASYKSTVKKRSWACRFKGGISQAVRNWEMFSICLKGMEEALKRIPDEGRARLASLLLRS